jgi:hypothetical protein
LLKSKFIDVVKTFSPGELKQFRDFLRSPFHNTNKNVIKMFEIVRMQAPQYNSLQLKKENVFKKLYPGKKYSDVVMRILISDSMRLSEEFLAYSRFSLEPMEEKVLLLKEYSSRNLNSLFETTLKRSELKLTESSISSDVYFLDRMFVEREKIDHSIRLDRQMLNGESLLSCGEYLISFFMLGLLNAAHDLHVQKDLYNLEPDYNIVQEFIKNFNFESFIKSLDESAYKYKYVVKIYYLMFLADMNIENDEYYRQFKNNLLDNVHKFNGDEKYELYLKLESVAIQKIERGNMGFYDELFEIYRELIKNKVYKVSRDSFMKLEMFRNIFFTGMTLGKIDWAEKFLSENISEISPEFRDNMLNQSMAYICFTKKDYSSALEYIAKVNYDLFVQKADVKIMMLKIYYELSMFETAISAMNSFHKFIQKNRNISQLFKNRYIEFLKIYKLLINKKSGISKVSSSDIEFETNNSKLAISKGWLVEKRKELF